MRDDRWATSDELLPDVVAEPAMRSAPESELDAISSLLLEVRILMKLVEFGLVEAEEGDEGSYPDCRRYRTTPLLAEFVSIRL